MKSKLLVALISISIILFVISWQADFSSIDNSVSNYFQNVQTDTGLAIMKVISGLGSFWIIFIISLVVLLILYQQKKLRNFLFYILILVGVLIGKLLKYVFQTERPLNPFETGFAFPSTHALASVLVFGAISYFLYKKSKTYLLILIIPILISFSRLYLNVHWFSDVIAGIAFGVFWLCSLIILFLHPIFKKNRKKSL